MTAGRAGVISKPAVGPVSNLAVHAKANKTAASNSITLAVADFDVAPDSTDFLVVVLSNWGMDEKSGATPGPPIGWTKLGGSTGFITVFTRSASGFSSSTWTGSGLFQQMLHAYAISGGGSFDVWDSGGSGAAPSVTTSGSTDLVIWLWHATHATSPPTITLPGEVTSQINNTANPNPAMTQRSGIEFLSASGATGTRVATVSSGGILTEAATVAIK